MRAACLVIGVCLCAASVSAQSGACLARTSSGVVARARLPSGVEVAIAGELEAHFSGGRASITVPALGLVASARAEDVEIEVVTVVETDAGVWLTPASVVRLSRVDGSRARVRVTGLGFHASGVRVPIDALGIAGARAGGGCAVERATPAGWDVLERERAAGREHVLLTTTSLRRRPGGAAGPARVERGARVVRVEERGRWSRVVLDDAGTRLVGWVRSRELEVAPTRPPGGGGAGLGRGLIALGCIHGERGERPATLARAATIFARPDGGALAELPAGTPLVLGAARGRMVAVVEVAGVRRIPRDCARDDGSAVVWIEADALAR